LAEQPHRQGHDTDQWQHDRTDRRPTQLVGSASAQRRARNKTMAERLHRQAPDALIRNATAQTGARHPLMATQPHKHTPEKAAQMMQQQARECMPCRGHNKAAFCVSRGENQQSKQKAALGLQHNRHPPRSHIHTHTRGVSSAFHKPLLAT
jgi:hypothetical protein